jgi:hypothetical protein
MHPVSPRGFGFVSSAFITAYVISIAYYKNPAFMINLLENGVPSLLGISFALWYGYNIMKDVFILFYPNYFVDNLSELASFKTVSFYFLYLSLYTLSYFASMIVLNSKNFEKINRIINIGISGIILPGIIYFLSNFYYYKYFPNEIIWFMVPLKCLGLYTAVMFLYIKKLDIYIFLLQFFIIEFDQIFLILEFMFTNSIAFEKQSI